VRLAGLALLGLASGLGGRLGIARARGGLSRAPGARWGVGGCAGVTCILFGGVDGNLVSLDVLLILLVRRWQRGAPDVGVLHHQLFPVKGRPLGHVFAIDDGIPMYSSPSRIS
jgi:hypothetical protein